MADFIGDIIVDSMLESACARECILLGAHACALTPLNHDHPAHPHTPTHILNILTFHFRLQL